MNKTIDKKKVLLGFISLIIIFYLINKIDVIELINIISSLKWENAIIALFLYFGNYLVRVKRLMIIFNIDNWMRSFQFIGLFQLINRTFPFRSGEAFFPSLMKRMFDINYSEGVLKLIIIRLFDLLTLFIVFSATILWLGIGERLYIVFFISLVLSIFWLLIYNGERLIGFIYDVGIIIFPRFKESAVRIKTNMINALKIDVSHLSSLFALSIIDKIFNFTCLVVIVYGLGFNIVLGKLFAAISLSGFSEILPINSFGNFGTLELGWVGALVYLGIDMKTGIESGFSSHLVVFSFTLLIGLLCLIPFIYRKPI